MVRQKVGVRKPTLDAIFDRMSALHLLEICDAVDSDAWHVDCHYVEEKRANVFLMLPDRPEQGRWMKPEGSKQTCMRSPVFPVNQRLPQSQTLSQ